MNQKSTLSLSDELSCGIITSYIYTIIYVASKKDFFYFEYIKNNDFHSHIYNILDGILSEFKINFFVFFAGPAPLLSCRSTLILAQGLFLSKNIDIILLQGYDFYTYHEFDSIIIQNFCGLYTLIEKNKIQENTFSTHDLTNKDFFNKKIALVAREGHAIHIKYDYSLILYPNIKKIIHDSYYKYKLKKTIKKVNYITPFQ